MTEDKYGHDWQGNTGKATRCRHCGTSIHSLNADRDCGWREPKDDDSSKFDVIAAAAEMVSSVFEAIPSIPDSTGFSSSGNSSDSSSSSDSFSSDAFSGGDSGGGGGGADY